MSVDAVREPSDELRLLAVEQLSGVALLSFDAEMRFTSSAGGALARLGLRAEEIFGRQPCELFGEVGWVLEARFCEALAGRCDEQTLDWAADGTVYVAVVSAVRDGQHAIVGGALALCEMTARRVEARAVTEPERAWRAVIEQSGDMLTRHDADGRYVYVSPASVRVIGYRPEELVGRHPLEFVHPDEVERVAEIVSEALRAGDGFQVEHRVLRPDGSCVWVQSLVRLQRDEHGRLGGVGAVRDISAQRAAEAALAEAESQSRAIIELSGDMLSRTDPEGRYLFASPSSVAVVGLAPAELIGLRLRDFAHPEDLERFDAAGREVRLRGSAEVEYRVRRPDGSYVWVHVLLRARCDEHGRLVEVVRAAREISEQKRQQARLLEATQRFERAFEHAPIGMALVGLDGGWLKVNRAMCAITGYSEAEMLTMSFRDITHPEDAGRSVDGLRGLQSGQTYKTEKRYLHAEGHVIWVQLACSVVCDERGSPQHFVTQTQDITERKKLQERLAYLAEHDSLTELYNRRRFESELLRQMSRSQRYRETAAVLVLDLDHFKYLNDSLGHHVGDGVIAHAGQLLAKRLRASDVLAMLGGDEYAVILPRVDASRAREVAAELISAIERDPFVHAGHRYALSASAGVVLLDQDTASAEDALVSADLAMHDAKQQGRNRVAVYSPETRQDILAGLSWSQRLKAALVNDAFRLHAQPIVDLESGETVMLELLIRMSTTDGELVPPGRFLHAAARFGYMPAIDRWVIAQAARLAGAAPGRCLAVNLAANTIAEPGLMAFITDTLRAAGADPADLIFEVSESDVIANLEHARSVCGRLRALGARIALDDFGSGFCGFSYLKALEIDLLKIDGQFVRELGSNRVDRLVIEAIVHVATGIEVPTVAEYVVNETVAQRLRELGVTYGQGFHLGKPAPLS
ncbi:MAG: PAS domain S-box protein [Solirubrobacteraceae bacterium]